MQHILFANMTSHVGQITNKKSHLASKVEMTHRLKMTKKILILQHERNVVFQVQN